MNSRRMKQRNELSAGPRYYPLVHFVLSFAILGEGRIRWRCCPIARCDVRSFALHSLAINTISSCRWHLIAIFSRGETYGDSLTLIRCTHARIVEANYPHNIARIRRASWIDGIINKVWLCAFASENDYTAARRFLRRGRYVARHSELERIRRDCMNEIACRRRTKLRCALRNRYQNSRWPR